MSLMSIGEFAPLTRLSPKALRLYDDLGLLPPASVDPDSGYRWYEATQLDRARLVASLRQIGVPLAQIKVMLGLEARAAAEQLAGYWTTAEAEHAARRALAGYLVDRLNGKRSDMYEVNVREIPERSLLCLERHVAGEDEVVAMGKEFVGLLRGKNIPRLKGITGAALLIYHGEVSEDSDGPIEWCQPVPEDQADETAARFPELTLRTEPAHEEAFVQMGSPQLSAAEWQLVSETLRSWAGEHHKRPSDLGVRVTFSVTPPVTADSVPDCDFAVPFR